MAVILAALLINHTKEAIMMSLLKRNQQLSTLY